MATAYYAGWAIYGRKHFLNDIDLNDVDEIVYAFFDVEADGSIRTIDPYEWEDKAFTAEESVAGVADTWEQGAQRGNQNQFSLLAEENPDLGLTVAFGGWTLSDQFSTAVLDENRANFVQNVVQMAKDNPWITGFDMDWEFPGSGGKAGNAIRSEDGANYAKFLEELRVALDDLSAETGKNYDISVASPPGLQSVSTFGFELGVAEHADTINLMAYDYHGGWEQQTGLQAGMFDTYSGNDGLGIAATITDMVDLGVDVSKVKLGIPLYARGWMIEPDTPAADALGAPSIGLVAGSYEKGVYDSKDILTQIENNPDNWDVVYDTDAMAAYAYNIETGAFVSIETRSTVALKTAWALANGMKGTMFWDSSSDFSEDGKSLMEASAEIWKGSQTVADIIASDTITFDYMTGDGAFYDMLALDAEGEPLTAAEADARISEQSNHSEGWTPDEGDGDDNGAGDGGDSGSSGETDNGQETSDGQDNAGGDNSSGGPVDGPDVGAGDGSDGGSDNSGSSDPIAAQALNNPEITKANADVVVSWSWGQNVSVSDFDPATDTIFIDWFNAQALEISEVNGSVTIAVPSNSQSLTLTGVTLAELDAANIHAMDETARAEFAGLLSGDADAGAGGPVDPGNGGPDGNSDTGNSGTDAGGDDTDGDAGGGIAAGDPEVVEINWNWAAQTIVEGFDLSEDSLDFNGLSAAQVDIREANGDLEIEVLGNGGNVTTLRGIQAEDLTLDHFEAAGWNSIVDEDSPLIGQLVDLGMDIA